MALIDVSELLSDPDFADSATLITRGVTVNEFGESVMSEEVPEAVTVVVAGNGGEESLSKLPEAVRLVDVISVYYAGLLSAERPGGYSDVIEWNGVRYQVRYVDNYMNFGRGFCRALCVRETVSA